VQPTECRYDASIDFDRAEDQEFEVDAVCEGRDYELTFDKDFKLVRKELD
jgi:hypothetical protein